MATASKVGLTLRWNGETSNSSLFGRSRSGGVGSPGGDHLGAILIDTHDFHGEFLGSLSQGKERKRTSVRKRSGTNAEDTTSSTKS